jgi:hypothetical protein
MRIVSARAGVEDSTKAVACIMCSLMFDCGNAPLRRITRERPPYPVRRDEFRLSARALAEPRAAPAQEVFTAYQMEIDRLRDL